MCDIIMFGPKEWAKHGTPLGTVSGSLLSRTFSQSRQKESVMVMVTSARFILLGHPSMDISTMIISELGETHMIPSRTPAGGGICRVVFHLNGVLDQNSTIAGFRFLGTSWEKPTLKGRRLRNLGVLRPGQFGTFCTTLNIPLLYLVRDLEGGWSAASCT